MSTSLCKSIKDGIIQNDVDNFLEIIKKSKFFCSSCGRTASKKKFLCKPEKIKSKSTSKGE